MRLRQLTGLEIDKLRAEMAELLKLIEYLRDILENDASCRRVMKDELIEIRDKYGDERRTRINLFSGDFNAEDFYPDDEMIITISHLGYIKRTPLAEFRAQHRGGVGSRGSSSREADFIEHIYPASNHNHILFFTRKGRCYWLKVYEIPEGAKNSKGRAIQNLLNLDGDDQVNAFIRVKNLQDHDFCTSHNLIFCTRQGIIKKTSLEAYSRPRTNGVNAIIIREGDQVIQVRLTDGNADIMLANRKGRAVRFHESRVREMGRMSTGVRGMTLDGEDDEVIGMITLRGGEEETVMVVSENGFGKRSIPAEYRITNRGGKGVVTMNVTEKTGMVVAIKNVTDANDLMIINQSGVTLRLPVDTIRVTGRATQGVKLIDLRKRGDVIASVCKVESDPETVTDEGEEQLKREELEHKVDLAEKRVEHEAEAVIEEADLEAEAAQSDEYDSTVE